jgi:hypothetical protein
MTMSTTTTMPIRMTPTRLAWLRHLHDVGFAERHSRAGFDCMHAGWTEWNVTDRKGHHMTCEQAAELFGGMPQIWEHVRVTGERLTPAGLAALQQAERSMTDND